jgi:glycosyltransferase involved in cell wall biosynthesis
MKSVMGNLPRKISLVLGSLRTGGAERAMVNLANGFSARGVQTDMVVVEEKGEFLSALNKGVTLHHLGGSRARNSVGAFYRYLKSHSPEVIIAVQPHIQWMVIAAVMLSRWKGILILNEQSTFSLNNEQRISHFVSSLLFRRADAISVVSKGAAADFGKMFPSLSKKVVVIPNPVFSDDILKRREEKVSHPYFDDKKFPVILAAGRLEKVKNYIFLLDAFSILLQNTEARLIILGEGEERRSLEQHVEELGITERVSLPGNVNNPFAFMSRCDVFALSSEYEGLPSVLIEALACGCNIVSTDCPNGPAEILDHGRFGRLVTPGDKFAFAEALRKSIFTRKTESERINRAKEFGIEKITSQYVGLINQLQ